jgi:hypothetical protein
MRSPILLALAASGLLAFAVRAEEKSPKPPARETTLRPWAYTTPRKPPLPAVRDRSWVINPIDAFVLARLEAQGLAPGRRADRLTLLRRVTFDLTGLPPTPAEQEAFLADDAPDAYERLVDRLLASPHYGERWAHHWLDLVRYAETDGFKADDLRPTAYQYRDWVIRALNADLPYDRFVHQQVAGDEMEPDDPQALVATGLQRLGPDEYNAANLEQRRQEILDDVTEVTGAAFLGLTVGCARCHDHKFDPISQEDYFRLQAHFAPMRARDDVPAADARERQHYRDRLAAWQAATRGLRGRMDEMLAEVREKGRAQALTKFRPEIQQAVHTPAEKRTPYQQVIAMMAESQLERGAEDALRKLPAEKKKLHDDLAQQLAAAGPRPQPPGPVIMGVGDVGRQAPPTHLLAGGDWRKPRAEMQPGFLDVLRPVVADVMPTPSADSTGRRAALARWLTQPGHPLTARVMVNRLWQHHFGVGIVATPSDFGSQGDPPTHPELLDWLAVEFVEHGWGLKHLHRLMVTSAAYCQASLVDPHHPDHARALRIDPDNKLLWHARRRRLEGEAMRDAMLAVSGELNRRPFGPSARPRLPEKISHYAWKPDARPEDQHRRSVYVFARRNMRFPLFDAFDLPDMHNSCARRSRTTTAPQALLLLNSDFTLERARHWCATLLAGCGGDDRTLVINACRAAWGRRPADEEIAAGLRFLQRQRSLLAGRGEKADEAAVDFCHALLNANAFLYVD